MSVEFSKLNKPGLGSGTFGVNKKKTGVSAQAAKNLANSSAASKSSVFSFGKSHGSNWVAGTNVSKMKNKYNYQGTRAALNSRTFTPSYSSGVSHVGGSTQTISVNNNTAFMKGQIVGQVLSQGISLLNQLGAFDSLKGSSSATNSQRLDAALNGLGGGNGLTNSGIDSYISDMASADNSIDLRGFIAQANGSLDELKSNAANNDFQGKYDTAKTNMTSYKSDVSKSEKGVSDAKQNVKTADNGVKTTTDVRDTKLIALKNADAAYGKAVEAHTKTIDATKQAEQNLANAKQTLANTDKTITITNPDGSTTTKPNPAYEKAQEAVDTAEQQLKAAKEEEAGAKTAREEAKKNVDSSNTAVKDAEAQLDKAQEQLNTAKDKQTTAQTVLQKAEKGFDEAQQILEKAQDHMERFEQFKQDSTKLQAAIDRYQAKLVEMEREEQEDYNKLTSKINDGVDKNNNRSSKINVSDGMNLKEKWLSYKTRRKNDKMEGQLDRKAGLEPMTSDTAYIKELKSKPAAFVVGGEKYYTGTTPSGQTIYLQGDSPITKDMFDKANPAST